RARRRDRTAVPRSHAADPDRGQRPRAGHARVRRGRHGRRVHGGLQTGAGRAMSGTLPFVLYVVFIASWFLHLPARFEFLAPLRVDLILVCVIAFFCWKVELPEPPSQHDARTRTLLLAVAVYALLSCPLVEWPGSVIKNGLPPFIKAAVFYYFTATLIGNTRRLKILLVVFVACEAFRVLEPVYLHLTEGYWGS